MPLSVAGLDWSGTSLPKQRLLELDLYVPCGIMAPNVQEPEQWLLDFRSRWNRSARFEFHGHAMTEAELLQVMEYIWDKIVIAAMFLDKGRLALETDTGLFSRPDLLPAATARPIVRRLLQREPIRRMWCDDDIPKPQQRAFNTAVEREARITQPNAGIEIKHWPSEKHCLIQIADMVAYVLQRETRGSFKTPQLRAIAKRMLRKEGNIIWWGSESDLRPYLPP